MFSKKKKAVDTKKSNHSAPIIETRVKNVAHIEIGKSNDGTKTFSAILNENPGENIFLEDKYENLSDEQKIVFDNFLSMINEIGYPKPETTEIVESSESSPEEKPSIENND